jgi:ankyrin repeat protein
VDPSSNYSSAIEHAVANGFVEIVKMLLKDGRSDITALEIAFTRAAVNGHAQVVQLLLSSSPVDPSVENNYAIGMASANGHIEVVRFPHLFLFD